MREKKIVIIDYGMGNLGSVKNMLKFLGIDSLITSDPEQILSADRIILPGVGSFDSGMSKIHELGIKQALDFKALEEKAPVLGICLGMQLMTVRSEEGTTRGLGWIDAETVKFNLNGKKLKIPHMGWNNVAAVNKNPLLEDTHAWSRFYFVHSYHVKCNVAEDIIGRTHYGIDFNSMISHDSIFGCQFHPEKSHKCGMSILKKFAELQCF